MPHPLATPWTWLGPRAAAVVVAALVVACSSSSSPGNGSLPVVDGGATSPPPSQGGSEGGAPAGSEAGAEAGTSPPSPPVHGIFDVRDFGATGNGTSDDSGAIQATIASATAAGGGIVYLPAGRYRVKAALTAGAAVTLAGEGFQPPGSGAPGSLSGSWLLVDASLLSTAAVTLADAGATLRDLGIWHDQPAPSAGWHPLAFGWAVEMASADTLVRDVWLANPTLGIHGHGRVTIENVQGQPITNGILIDHAYDVVRLRRIRFNWTEDGGPVWSSDPSVTSQLGVAVESLRDDNPEIYDVKVSGYATGLHFGADTDGATGSPGGPTSKFSLMHTTVYGAARCVTIDGANTTGKMTRFWGNGCATTGIWLHAPGAAVSAADLDLREVGDNAVRVEAAGAAFLVNQLTVVDWNTSGVGFPAVEAADPNATVKVGLYTSYTGNGPEVGGVGHALVDTGAADSAYDLRIPVPTEIVEDGLEPFDAKVDVVQRGAKGDGKADDTAAIQAALDAAAASGGGSVLVPAGDYRVTGSIQVPSGVSLVGVGWNASADKGARLLVDAANTSDVVQLGDGAALRSIGMHWDQGNVVAGWQPSGTFGWGVRVTGSHVVVRDVFLLNPTRGILVSSAGTGPVLLDRVVGSPNAVGLEVDTNAALRVNGVHFWPFWGVCAGSPPNGCQPGTFAYEVNAPKEASGIAYRLDSSAHAELSNVFSIGYATGVLLGSDASGQVNSDLRVWNADQDIFGARGYTVTGANTQATFANFSCQGDNGSDQAVTGVWAEPSALGAQVAAYNGDLRIFTANAVRDEAPGASIAVNLMRMDAWDGSGRGFPVVEAAGGAASAGPEVWENGQ